MSGSAGTQVQAVPPVVPRHHQPVPDGIRDDAHSGVYTLQLPMQANRKVAHGGYDGLMADVWKAVVHVQHRDVDRACVGLGEVVPSLDARVREARGRVSLRPQRSQFPSPR